MEIAEMVIGLNTILMVQQKWLGTTKKTDNSSGRTFSTGAFVVKKKALDLFHRKRINKIFRDLEEGGTLKENKSQVISTSKKLLQYLPASGCFKKLMAYIWRMAISAVLTQVC
jgi:hypothetical protein